jgi:hypothetical protein
VLEVRGLTKKYRQLARQEDVGAAARAIVVVMGLVVVRE